MKKSASIIFALVVLIIIAAVCRIIPNRPGGFAPQIAMAIFGGAIFIKDKKWAFLLPIASLFISDLLAQILYKTGLGTIPGFYEGQLVNYAIFASVTLFGFLIKKIEFANVIIVSILSASYFFLVSNFSVWATTSFYPHTMEGLQTCLAMGVPFYKNSLIATLLFSGILFGSYTLFSKYTTKSNHITF